MGKDLSFRHPLSDANKRFITKEPTRRKERLNVSVSKGKKQVRNQVRTGKKRGKMNRGKYYKRHQSKPKGGRCCKHHHHHYYNLLQAIMRPDIRTMLARDLHALGEKKILIHPIILATGYTYYTKLYFLSYIYIFFLVCLIFLFFLSTDQASGHLLMMIRFSKQHFNNSDCREIYSDVIHKSTFLLDFLVLRSRDVATNQPPAEES